MGDTVIRAENVGKKYIISHQYAGEYATLRDRLADGARAIARQLRNVGKLHAPTIEREEFWALQNVSFEIKQGERVGIIGRNGAGKSTLLKILSQITEPTTGEILIRGRVASLLEVGTGFHLELTGRENIFLNGAILGMSRAEIKKKFDEIVAFAEVEQFLDTPVKRYSSGMYVRLAFAVAAHLEPEILLIDEVLAVGDVQFQKKCIGKMGEISTQGRTIIFVSHNMSVLQTLCQRGILLSDKTIKIDANVSNAVQQYLHTLEQATAQSLLERQDRSGKGETRLSQIQLFVHEAIATTTLITGQTAKFVFRVSRVIPNLACVFTIYNQFGQAVTNFDSKLQSPEDTFESTTKGVLICATEELLLVPDRYRINVAILGNGELQDHIEAALIFDVEAGRVRDRPLPEDSNYGNIIHPHRWTIC
uniref:ABC transporter related n=1 Tax=Cyanothece sp. (strain PCC 7425 / ATCC 29141) TaxID=395961 RepID=B8HRA6_CYAP4